MIVPRVESSGRSGSAGMLTRSLRCALGALSIAAALGVACSDDDANGGQCIGGGGPVAGVNENHCIENGVQVKTPIGMCSPSGEAEAEGDEGEEEEHAILFGREADDDDCKYHVSFDNTCVTLNQPVTFTLSLTRLIDGAPGSGTNPAYPEIFFEADGSLSPSNNITATEGPLGTYKIGPVLFNKPGRWVIRFHYFENCSELPPDSPHSHVAFYIDVP
jgi:hypothetical protein